MELVRAKREALANRVIASFQDGAIQVLRGKFGPYITDGSKNGKIPKDVAPEDLSAAACIAILAAAPAKAAGKGRFGRKGAKPEAPKKTRTVKAKPAAGDGEKAAPKKKAVAKKATTKKPAAKKASTTKTTARKPKAAALKRA